MAALTNLTHNNLEGGDSMTAQVVQLVAGRHSQGDGNRLDGVLAFIRERLAEQKTWLKELDQKLQEETDPNMQKVLHGQIGRVEGRIEELGLMIDLLTGRLEQLAEEFAEDEEAL